jgi:hypothetical protein
MIHPKSLQQKNVPSKDAINNKLQLADISKDLAPLVLRPTFSGSLPNIKLVTFNYIVCILNIQQNHRWSCLILCKLVSKSHISTRN